MAKVGRPKLAVTKRDMQKAEAAARKAARAAKKAEEAAKKAEAVPKRRGRKRTEKYYERVEAPVLSPELRNLGYINMKMKPPGEKKEFVEKVLSVIPPPPEPPKRISRKQYDIDKQIQTQFEDIDRILGKLTVPEGILNPPQPAPSKKGRPIVPRSASNRKRVLKSIIEQGGVRPMKKRGRKPKSEPVLIKGSKDDYYRVLGRDKRWYPFYKGKRITDQDFLLNAPAYLTYENQ